MRKLFKIGNRANIASGLMKYLRFALVSFLAFGILLFLACLIFPLKVNVSYSMIITDRDGSVVNAFLNADDKWRMKTELEEISPLLEKAIIAKEDKYFYYHPGFNLLAIGRAALNNIIHLKTTSGASTITMQVARALEKRPRTYMSKMLEIFRAIQLELKYSKKEILQLYLNLIPYGSNIEGVKAASLIYFDKFPDHLSLAEITTLSIIPNRPSSLRIGRNNTLICKQRNKWLITFLNEKVFPEKVIREALNEPLTADRLTLPHLAPHLSQKLKSTSASQVKSTIVTNLQLKIEKLTEDYTRGLRLKNINNAAVIIVDNKTRKVLAYLGSASFKDTVDAGQVNGATAIRQPGSTLKPLLYALSIDRGLYTPKSIIEDIPINYAGYAPENYDQTYNGYVSLEKALELSLNIPAVKGLDHLGKDIMLDKLIAAGFRQVKKDRKKLGLSLILGGCGTNLEELTALFSTFANEGIYKPLLFSGEEGNDRGIPLFSAASGFMVTEILSKVARPDFPLSWSATENLPRIAWKTGTSYGRKDAWSIGYNKKYTVGVWVGNFSGVGNPELSGAASATPLLFKIFNTIDYKNDGEWFSMPPECEVRKICTETGLPPGIECSSQAIDYYIPLVSSSKTCDHLRQVRISSDGLYSYCDACVPESGYKKKTFRAISVGMQQFYASYNIPFEKMPPHNPACQKVFNGEGPSITSPANGTEYLVNKQNPDPLFLKASASQDVRKLYWYLNDQFYKATPVGEKIPFTPQEGRTKISCTDDKGRNRNIYINVRYVNW